MLNKKVMYHLSCPLCSKLWWSENAFPKYCPYCKQEIPTQSIKYDDLLKNMKKEVKYNDK